MPDSVQAAITRPLVRADLGAVAAIYNDHLANGTPGYHTGPIDDCECEAWLFNDPPAYRKIVCHARHRVVGWAGLAPFDSGDAYAPTAQVYLYVAPNWSQRGVGRVLALGLLSEAKAVGFHSVIAIVIPRPLHLAAWLTRLGFRRLGGVPSAFPKSEGEWSDLVLYQRFLSTVRT